MQNTQINTDTNKYYFQGIRFVPSYRDFDFDDCEIEATNEKEAWDKLDKLTNIRTWKSVGITHINGLSAESC